MRGEGPSTPEFYRTPIRVHWADTDAAGIVWFGNFLRYFEEAEDELFRALGQTRLALLRRHGILMPRVETTCRFRTPARAEDLLSVGIAVREFTGRRIQYQFEAKVCDPERIVCEGEYRVACVDATTMQSREFPGAIRDLVARVPALVRRQRLQRRRAGLDAAGHAVPIRPRDTPGRRPVNSAARLKR